MMERFGKLVAPVLVAVALSFANVVFAEAPTVPSRSATAAATRERGQTSPSAVQGLNVRVESVPTVELKSPSGGLKELASPIVSLLSVVIALIAVVYGKRSNDRAIAEAQRSNEATLWQKANETELKDIQAQLDEFYGPYQQLSEANHLMAQELRARQPDVEKYRMLVRVFDQAWLARLSAADRTIVREVCGNALKLETFIQDHAKMVDPQILPYLSRASAHFRILYLAHKGELGSEFPPHLARYVYPRNLDKVLKLEVERLQRRCSALRSSPYTAPGPIEHLIIPKDLSLEEWPSPPRTSVETIMQNMTPGPSEASVVRGGTSDEERTVIDKLRSKGLLEEGIAAEIAALWKYGVERVQDTEVRGALADYLANETPLAFFVSPASMTGEHHPYWQSKKGGIVRNTVECCVVVDRQLQVYPEFTDTQYNVLSGARDVVLVATILSDTFKYHMSESAKPDETMRFDPEHGKMAADKWRQIATRHRVSGEVADQIYEATYWHLGRWTPGWERGKQWSPYVQVTHCVDMFMSDKSLEVLYDPKARIAVET